MTKLKHCPLCGGEAYIQEHVYRVLSSTYGVVCFDCKAGTDQFYETIDDAVEAWNRRTTIKEERKEDK